MVTPRSRRGLRHYRVWFENTTIQFTIYVPEHVNVVVLACELWGTDTGWHLVYIKTEREDRWSSWSMQ